MRKIKIPRQKMDFASKYLHLSSIVMGLSIFLRCVFFTGLNELSAFDGKSLFVWLYLPLAVCGIYIVMTAIVQVNIPVVYCSLGVLICLVSMLWSFSTGNLLRILLSILCYGGTAALLVCIFFGLLRDYRLVATFLGVCMILRVLLFEKMASELPNLVFDLSNLLVPVAIVFLPLTIERIKK